ncbi:HNH endonuclease [Photobacterium kagoshimensis]|uniref:HNH endonuclease n=1 Tax=Photobacterium kagoshimensis TaxID=2910242 RepID=UPI003D108912
MMLNKKGSVVSINWEHRAGILWEYLIKNAKESKKMTYGEAAKIIKTNPLSVRYCLDHILHYCKNNQLPPLTALVVSQGTKVPGSGFLVWDIEQLDEAYRQIVKFDWKGHGNPFSELGEELTTDDLAIKLLEQPDKAEQIYQQVKSRGMAQIIFRKALLEAYECKCAICDLGYEEALEAAHIIPWSRALPAEKIAPTNGVLLCSNHHKLFDAGWLTIDDEYQIHYAGELEVLDFYSKSDKSATVAHHGRKIRLPQDAKLHPQFE